MGHKHLTKDEFNKLKLLLDSGVPIAVVHQITGRSGSLLSKVNQADDFAGYKALIFQRNHPARLDPAVPAAPLAAKPEGMEPVVQLLTTMNATLARIEEQLTLLADLGAAKPKTGFFK